MDASGVSAALRTPGRGDLALAAALLVGMALAGALSAGAGSGARAGSVVASFGLFALAWRRAHPVAALAMVLVVALVEVEIVPGTGAPPVFLALMVAVYSLAAYAMGWPLAGGLVLAVGGVASAQLLAPSQRQYTHLEAIPFFLALLVAAPALVGLVSGSRRRLGGRLRRGAEEFARVGDVQVWTAVVRERALVVRDVDLLVLDGLDGLRAAASVATIEELSAVEQAGRALLSDMRRLLVGLRAVEGEPLRPAQAAAELREQIEAVLAGGGAVAAGDGEPRRGRDWARWTVFRPVTADRALALGSLSLAVALAATRLEGGTAPPHRLAGAVLAATLPLPLAWARRRPLAAAAACAVATMGYVLVAEPADPLAGLAAVPLLILAPLVAGTIAPATRALAGLTLCLGGMVTVALLDESGAGFDRSGVAASGAVVLGCWLGGWMLRSGTGALAAKVGQALGQQERQRARALLALERERARLARELHDAIGHALTVIVLQATAARRVWQSDPALAAEHVQTLRQTLSETLCNLRPLVLSLTLGDTSRGLGRDSLPDLLERARSCGLRIVSQIAPADLPKGVEAAVYRIAQEALTNAARHASGAEVVVRISEREGSLRVEIVNGAPALPPIAVVGGGQGSRGMAERVADCGGTLSTGPTPDGGFAVIATLPVGTA